MANKAQIKKTLGGPTYLRSFITQKISKTPKPKLSVITPGESGTISFTGKSKELPS
jgi:hypothetical protein